MAKVINLFNKQLPAKPNGPHCARCHGTSRLVEISAKCSDMFTSTNVKDGKQYDGYVPEWAGPNGYGDYIEMTICRHCGHIQGKWPFDASEGSKDKYKWGKVL